MLPSIQDELSLSNLQRPEIRANPYPFYAQLREEDPVHWDDSMGYWVLTRYADIAAVYNDPRFSRAEGLRRWYERVPETEKDAAAAVYNAFSKTMFYADPPYHTRLRGLVSAAFTPKRIEGMRANIQQIIDNLLDGVQRAEQMDVIYDVAYPLPVLVIANMLGFPAEDRKKFKAWSDDIFAVMGTVQQASQLMEKASQSLGKMAARVVEMSQERGAQPQDDLFSALVAAVEAGEKLSQDELIANVVHFLSAGHETTSNLIGNGLLALLQNPDQLKKLRENPNLMELAVEEMLRYDSPVQIAFRAAVEDVEIGGKTIRKSDLVNMILASANRDPEKFTNPDAFDVTRDEGRHLSFGLGIHFCIGAPLARIETQIVFASFLQRFPDLESNIENITWQEHPIFRGVKSLPVTF